MMKRFWVMLIALTMTFSCALAARAEAATETLFDMVAYDGERLFYSGSVDGTEVGIFSMNPDGSDVRRIYEDELLISACLPGRLLLFNWETDESIILSGDGAVIATIPNSSASAIAADGMFYTGYASFDANGGHVKTLIEPDPEARFLMTPVAVEDGYVYFLDAREYGMHAMEMDNPAALIRISLADHSIQEISAPGTRFIGMDDRYLYYQRTVFWINSLDPNAEGAEVEVDEGLFRAEKDGSNEVRLGDVSDAGGDWYIHYECLAGDTLYGIRHGIDRDEAAYTLVRTSIGGQPLPETPLKGYHTLHGIKGDALYAVKVEYVITQDDYRQDEVVLAIDLADLSATPILSDPSYILAFTEGPPLLRPLGDGLIFISYDSAMGASSLYACNLDGSGAVRLAIGYRFID